MKQLPSEARSLPALGRLRVLLGLLRQAVPSLRRPVVRYGNSRFHADLSTALGKDLYRHGYSSPELDLVRRLLSEGDVFIDGGANVGLFTIAGAECVGRDGKVIAFEPAAPLVAMLRENIELNEYQDRVEVKQAALGSRSGTADFFEFEGDQSSWSSFAPPWNNGNKITVAVTTLDQSVPKTQLNRVRLVKLDLEGAEAAALAGAERLLAACDNFVVEVEDSHLRRQGATAEDILRVFRDRGFAAAVIDGGPNVHFYRPR